MAYKREHFDRATSCLNKRSSARFVSSDAMIWLPTSNADASGSIIAVHFNACLKSMYVLSNSKSSLEAMIDNSNRMLSCEVYSSPRLCGEEGDVFSNVLECDVGLISAKLLACSCPSNFA